jgi:hypothetical protein
MFTNYSVFLFYIQLIHVVYHTRGAGVVARAFIQAFPFPNTTVNGMRPKRPSPMPIAFVHLQSALFIKPCVTRDFTRLFAKLILAV